MPDDIAPAPCAAVDDERGILLLGGSPARLASGIAAWLGAHPGWRVRDGRRYGHPSWERLVRTLRPQALVVAHRDERDLDAARAAAGGLPVVGVGGPPPAVAVSGWVGADPAALGAAAALHLRGLGLRSFAAGGLALGAQGPAALAAFADGCAPLPVATPPYPDRQRFWAWSGAQIRRFYAAWLSSLPRPCGVLALYELAASALGEAARLAGLRIPDDLALLTIGGGEPSLLHQPPISVLDADGARLGWEAPALAARLVDGAARDTRITVAPTLWARRSTDVSHLDDPALARALAAIRGSAGRLAVDRVAAAAHMSRRALERRFRAVLGTAVGDEILRVRMALAEDLLADGDLPLRQIARRAGYRDEASFCRAFRRRRGLPPGEWRRRRGAG